MALIRWRPMRDMFSLQHEINRMFDDVLARPEGEDSSALLPAADIVENKDSFSVTAELPGLKKEDIKVTLQNNILTISGEKKQQSETKGQTYHRIERSFGSFSRTFDLPAVVDASKIKAEYKDGVLRIELPKVEEAKAKEISIGVS